MLDRLIVHRQVFFFQKTTHAKLKIFSSTNSAIPVCQNKTHCYDDVMKKILLLLVSLPLITFADPSLDKRLVSELSINELKQIVRSIVEESIEQCVVTGTMEGRAKVNLKVEGEVVAKMECEFKQPNKIEEVKKDISS